MAGHDPPQPPAAGLDLETDTSIRQLQRRPNGWHLLSAERGWLDRRFDAVLLALPAPQAVPLLREAAPGLAALAGSVVMRGAWALMLRFAAPLEVPFDAAFVNDGKVEGAWLSGRQLGERMAAHFRDHGATTVGRQVGD